jgi:hypothetical protein
MKIRALVVEDKIVDWEDDDGKARKSRSLLLVDQDEDNRLDSMFKLSIKPDDRIAGPMGQANIRGTVVTAAITGINQNDRNKKLGFSGVLLAIEGVMEFKSTAGKPGPIKG